MDLVAFHGTVRIATGNFSDVVTAIKKASADDDRGSLLIFNAETSEPIEVDLRGNLADVLKRIDTTEKSVAVHVDDPPPRGPGRPKLGVVAREVTLLPRHWEWLAGQRGGASVALRRLVEEARRGDDGVAKVRAARDAAYRFMSAMAGNEPGFEEAARALYAGDGAKFEQAVAAWPADVRAHALTLAARGFGDGESFQREGAKARRQEEGERRSDEEREGVGKEGMGWEK